MEILSFAFESFAFESRHVRTSAIAAPKAATVSQNSGTLGAGRWNASQ